MPRLMPSSLLYLLQLSLTKVTSFCSTAILQSIGYITLHGPHLVQQQGLQSAQVCECQDHASLSACDDRS